MYTTDTVCITMHPTHGILRVANHQIVLQHNSLGWEVLHVQLSDTSTGPTLNELQELADAFTEYRVSGVSLDATINYDQTVNVKDGHLDETNGTVLNTNVTFAKVTGAQSLRRLTDRDIAQVKSLCSKSECLKGNGTGALCFREVSGQNKVSFSDGQIERDVVIVTVNSCDAERHRAHVHYLKTLAAHQVGPKLYSSECTDDAQYYFTEKLGTCTTLDQFLESAQAKQLNASQLDNFMESLISIGSVLTRDNRKDACFHYRGQSFREFTQDTLVDVASGNVYMWRTRHISYFRKNCREESLALGYEYGNKVVHTKKTKAECVRTLWGFLSKIAAELYGTACKPNTP